jgi:hypothetical protein
MAEALGIIHMHGKGLLQVRWWPLGSKSVFEKMTAPVPEIMDCSLYCVSSLIGVHAGGYVPKNCYL